MPFESIGKAVIFSAPSGAGKTTIVRSLLRHEGLKLAFSVSATTREPRRNERDHHDYHFLSIEEFDRKIAADEFVEWEEVYPGRKYGTLKSELHRIWKEGKTVLFDVDVVGGATLKGKLGEAALAVFIQPPSLEELRLRLESRGTDDADRISERMKKAAWEINQSVDFDRVLINDDLQKACDTAYELVHSFIESSEST